MNIMAETPNKTAAEQKLIEQFGALSVEDTGTVHELRRSAFEQFEGVGLPHRRVEAYKYTDLKRALTDVPPIAMPFVGSLEQEASVDGFISLSVINGRVGSLPSLPEGVTIRSLRDVMGVGDAALTTGSRSARALAADDPLVQLNTAFMSDGVVIEIAAGVHVDQPIDIHHLLAGDADAATYTRHIVHVGEGASVHLVESHMGGSVAHLSNCVVELTVGNGAQVTLARRLEGAVEDRTFSSTLIDLHAEANLQHFTMNLGSALARGQLFIKYEGEGAHSDLLGATVCGTTQLLDTTLFVDHAVPNCTSKEVFKTVVSERGQSVFQGKIIVRQHAQKTDAQMMSRSLLLSEEAEAINKPELEIYADDVQCAHGATSGAIDEDMLFYLLSRGLPRLEAERLLVQAFVAEPIEELTFEPIRDLFMDRMLAHLAKRSAA